MITRISIAYLRLHLPTDHFQARCNIAIVCRCSVYFYAFKERHLGKRLGHYWLKTSEIACYVVNNAFPACINTGNTLRFMYPCYIASCRVICAVFDGACTESEHGTMSAHFPCCNLVTIFV